MFSMDEYILDIFYELPFILPLARTHWSETDFLSLDHTWLFSGNLIEDMRTYDYFTLQYPDNKEWNRTDIDCTALTSAAQWESILLKACAV